MKFWYSYWSKKELEKEFQYEYKNIKPALTDLRRKHKN